MNQHFTSRLWRILLAGMLLLASSTQVELAAQRIAPVGEWTAYVSHLKPKKIARKGDDIYCITEGGLYTYNVFSKEMRTYTTIEGLSGTDPSALHVDPNTGFVFLGYTDGTMNAFQHPDEDILYITDIKRSELYTTKSINEFASHQGLLYAATEFGIVVYDIENRETRSAVTKIGEKATGSPVTDLAVRNDTIWAAVDGDSLYYADLRSPNLTLPDVWKLASGQNGLPTGLVRHVEADASRVYAAVGARIYWFSGSTNTWIRDDFPAKTYLYLQANDGYLSAVYDKFIRYRGPGGPETEMEFQFKPLSVYADDDLLLIGDSKFGLQRHVVDTITEDARPNGPQNNLIQDITVGNGELYIAPEGVNPPTAPAWNYDGFYRFTMEEGWRIYNLYNDLPQDSIERNFGRCHYDIENNRCYMGSWSDGVLMLEDGEVTAVWMPTNSNLTGMGSTDPSLSNQVRISGLATDKAGLLWAAAVAADYELNVLDESNNWIGYKIPNTRPVGMIVDDWGTKWMINLLGGLTVFNENGTLDNIADDDYRNITADAGNGGLPNSSVYALAKDLRGHIWVGTLEGIAVFSNPSAVFSNNFNDASCPVIDGFCLLRDQRVNSIAVDGANRKWIGTTNGVYVVNPQGNELIHHYTTENRQRYENDIREIEIDGTTGEIFIGTASKGLISLMGEATEGKETSDDLYVFPNPIYADYDGPVSVTGSVRDAEVKITTVSGQLVIALEAKGGQAVWDGRDRSGRRLAPGIYLAIVADEDGQTAGIAKFVVLDQNQ